VSTVQYWVARWQHAREADCCSGRWAQDRLSTPHHQPARVSDEVHDRVREARRRTGWGPRLIASELGMAHATVSRCLTRRGPVTEADARVKKLGGLSGHAQEICCKMDTKRLARFSRPGHRVTGDHYRTSQEKGLRGRLGVLSLDHR
jgi:hypothetical protein